MSKMKLYEYAVLLHPKKKKDEWDGKTTLIQKVETILAKDEKQVGILAARAIPSEHMDNLDRVEVVVRPF